jgi:ubiquinone biosynthesis accessory factor UbiJ
MLHTLRTLAGTAVMERATLLFNHVLSSEAVATERLRAHTGRCIRLQFEGWPALLPAWPSTAFRITPAGLLEWLRDGADAEAGLQVTIDAGDAALASDVNWLFDNLRWDLVDDLEHLVGPAAAHQLGMFGKAIAAAVKSTANTLAGFGRDKASGGPPGP